MPEKCKKTTIGMALNWTIEKLKEANLEDAQSEAEFLLTHILNMKRHKLFLSPGYELTSQECKALKNSIARRLTREPVQYIAGETEFYGLRIKLNRSSLIPRPETEILVDEAKKAASNLASPLIIDLCTGSGCIAIAVANELPNCRVVAADIVPGAIEIARENAQINNLQERVTFVQGDLFKPLSSLGLERMADIILSNPPYISAEDYANNLAVEVRDYEPRAALYGGPDGGDFIRKIIEGAPRFLKPRGVLIMEFGYDQACLVEDAIGNSSEYDMHIITKDLNGIDRVLKARAKQ